MQYETVVRIGRPNRNGRIPAYDRSNKKFVLDRWANNKRQVKAGTYWGVNVVTTLQSGAFVFEPIMLVTAAEFERCALVKE